MLPALFKRSADASIMKGGFLVRLTRQDAVCNFVSFSSANELRDVVRKESPSFMRMGTVVRVWNPMKYARSLTYHRTPTYPSAEIAPYERTQHADLSFSMC